MNPFKYISHNLWEPLVKAIIDAIRAFKDNQKAQAGFFKKGEKVLDNILEEM